MKKSLLLSAAIFVASALSIVAAPTPTASPSPSASPTVGAVYADTTQKMAVRLAAAKSYLPTLTDPVEIEAVTYFIAINTLQTATKWTEIQTFAESMIASRGAYYTGPSDGTGYTQARQDNVFVGAVQRKATLSFTKVDDRMAFVVATIGALPDGVSDYVVGYLNQAYLAQVNAKTTDYINQGNYSAALANAMQGQLLNSPGYCAATIQNILKIKTITHAADVLPWAKAVYVMGSFAGSSQTSVMVANAFRSEAGMAAGNAFISSQTDDTIPNPLASVPFPDILQGGPLPEPQYAAINVLFRGDAKGALALARAHYDSAISNSDLNTAGNEVAAALRNFHGNLIRANQFVDSNKPVPAGSPAPTPFVFTELQ